MQINLNLILFMKIWVRWDDDYKVDIRNLASYVLWEHVLNMSTQCNMVYISGHSLEGTVV